MEAAVSGEKPAEEEIKLWHGSQPIDL